MAELKAGYGPLLTPNAWEQDLAADRLVLETHGVKPWRLLISEYRRTRDRLAGLHAAGGKTGAKDLLAMVDAVQSHQRNQGVFDEHGALGPELFGGRWQGRDSDWPKLRALSQWLVELHGDVSAGRLPQGLLDYLAWGPVSGQLPEMAARIADHRARRGNRWRTVEAPLDLVAGLRDNAAADRAVLVDCLTLWLANLIDAGRDVEAETAALSDALPTLAGPVVMVSNAVGLGIVPDNALARAFRDAAGRLNQAIAAAAQSVVFIAAGLPLPLKSPEAPEARP